ncbi:MAG: imelysin family protein [Methylobacterium sp.]
MARAQAPAPEPAAVLRTYSDIALATYEDALLGAKALKEATDALIVNPSAETLEKARTAWKASRPAYQQSEAFRFGNPVVDDWEGRVNAWPLDEGLIDYVDPAYGSDSDTNSLYTANVVANRQITINGEAVDTSAITPELLRDKLQEAGDVEANVATGYHAIEFMLWGQDLNGTGPGAGNRPWTDYSRTECTNGNCDRRGEYLTAATELLVADLEEMVGDWRDGGAARKHMTDDPAVGIPAILTGLGSLSYGELAGERMKLGLLLHDPEEEHDCFSDNTHVSHFNDVVGIRNVYEGRYKRVDGETIEGPSIAALIAAKDPAIDKEIHARIEDSLSKMGEIVKAAEGGEAYDQQIAEGNAAGNARVQAAIDALIAQTRAIERGVAALGAQNVAIEGSDSLDNQGAVFQ